MSVPANWPVYDLAKNPRQCVRYDIHAVNLGSPRPDQDQDCPPDLVGRVDTISIGSVPEVPEVPKTPEVPGALPVPQASPVERGPAGDRKTPARTGQQAGVIVPDPNLHELVLTMPDSAPPIGATYGTDPGSTTQILATVHPDGTRHSPAVQASSLPRAGDAVRVSRQPVIAERPAAEQAAAKAPAQDTDVKGEHRNPAWPVVTTPPTGIPPGWLPPSDKPVPPAPPTPTPTPKPTGPVLANNPVPAPPTTPGSTLPGFDTCRGRPRPTRRSPRPPPTASARALLSITTWRATTVPTPAATPRS